MSHGVVPVYAGSKKSILHHNFRIGVLFFHSVNNPRGACDGSNIRFHPKNVTRIEGCDIVAKRVMAKNAQGNFFEYLVGMRFTTFIP